jgi:hypothetical protein
MNPDRRHGMSLRSRLGLLMAILSVGCSGPEFVPDITLPQARPIIDATAEFHDLYPAPALLSGKESFGLDSPKAKHVEPSDLTDRVEAELMAALNDAGVFTRITRFDPEPDLILTGRINSLQERLRPQIWSKLPYLGTVAQVLDVKSHISSGEADLTLFVLKPNGELIGKYTGRSTFKETFNPTKDVPPGARLNHALSEAVEQIQKKLVEDAHLRTVAASLSQSRKD